MANLRPNQVKEKIVYSEAIEKSEILPILYHSFSLYTYEPSHKKTHYKPPGPILCHVSGHGLGRESFVKFQKGSWQIEQDIHKNKI